MNHKSTSYHAGCTIFVTNSLYANWLKVSLQQFAKSSVLEPTVEPQLSEPHGRHTIRSDNRGVQFHQSVTHAMQENKEG